MIRKKETLLEKIKRMITGSFFPSLPNWQKNFDWKIEIRWMKTDNEITKKMIDEGKEIPFYSDEELKEISLEEE